MNIRVSRFAAVFAVVLFAYALLGSVSAYADQVVLEKGARGSVVLELQAALKTLGYFKVEPTGYYGDVTVDAVKELQEIYNINVDGKVTQSTMSLVRRLAARRALSSRAGDFKREEEKGYLVPWFDEAQYIFPRDSVATVYDVESGISFKVKRTYGYNHADCEPLTIRDTAKMKKIFGGQWSWERRAVIVTVNGRRIAASMSGMPHAGVEDKPADTYVEDRSDGYGSGDNLDKIKGNDFEGHFDIHFYGSRTHTTNRVDEKHQSMAKKAAEWAEEKY